MQGADEPGRGPRPDSAPTSLGTAGLGLGERLRSARKARALSIEQLAETLRLEVTTVVALEEGRFETLGAPVFVRGHLKRYAALVGLPVDAVLEAYRTSSPESVAPPAITRHRDTDDRTGLRPWGLRVLLPVCVLAALIWIVGGRRSATPPPPAEPTVTGSAPAGPVAEPVAAAPAEAPAPPPATDAGPAANASPPVEAPPPAPAPRPIAGGTSVQLVFTDDSFISVGDAERRLLYGLQKRGTRQDLKGRPPFHVMIGNARGVEVSVDGQPVDLPPSAIVDNVARFDVPAPPGQKPGEKAGEKAGEKGGGDR